VMFYLAFAAWQMRRARKHHKPVRPICVGIAISALVPVITVSIMVLVFLVIGASRTAQFNAGLPGLPGGWSLWVSSWKFLLVANAVSVVANAARFLFAVSTAPWRQASVFGLWGIGLSLLAAYTVFAFYPTA
jgi:hypothetical protein